MNPLLMSQGRHKRNVLTMLVVATSAIVALTYLPWKDSVANVLKTPEVQQQARDMAPVTGPTLGHTLNELFRRR